MAAAPTVVFFNTHHRGHIAPTVTLATNFVAAGVRVVYFAPSASHELLVSAAAELRAYHDDAHWTLSNSALKVVSTPLSLEPDQELLDEQFLVQILPVTVDLLQYCVEQLKTLRPKLVVYDCACPWGKLSASLLAIPAVSSCSSTLIGVEERKQMMSFLVDREDSKACLKWLVENHGLEYDPCDVYCNYDEYTIVWSLPELQPHSKGFPFAHFFGASVGAGPVESQGFDLSSIQAAKKDGKRIVYFSMGTVVGQEGKNVDLLPFYRQMVAHFASNPKYFIIYSVGKEGRSC